MSGGGVVSWRAMVLGVFLLGFVTVYFYLATQLIYQTNANRLESDQEHNINQAELAMERAAAEDAEWWHRLPHFTKGVVNPLWPWVAGHLAATEDHREFFRRGKWVQVVWTGVFCVLLGVVVARGWTLLGVMNLVLLAGFGAFLIRATYFQPEPLYYLFFFLSWVCCLRLLWRNPLWLYGLLGLSAGLAYLAKSSVQPMLLVFIGVTTVRFVVVWWQAREGGGESGTGEEKGAEEEVADGDDGMNGVGRWRGREEAPAWSRARHLVGLVLLLVAFLLPTIPRLMYAHETFGDAFHSYPSYWMWMDSFPEGVVFAQRHVTRDQLEAMRVEDKPSLGNYLKTHSAADFRERMTSGVERVATDFVLPGRVVQREGEALRPWRRVLPARGWYLGFLAGVLAVTAGAGWWQWRSWREAGPPRCECGGAPMLAVVFVVGVVAIYALAYGWYVEIGRGDRFMMSLYLPLAFTLIWASELLVQRVGSRWLRYFYGGASAVLFAAICWRLGALLGSPLFEG